jgi:hypothetical protein
MVRNQGFYYDVPLNFSTGQLTSGYSRIKATNKLRHKEIPVFQQINDLHGINQGL